MRKVKEQFSNFRTDVVAEITVQRRLIDKDQIDRPGFVREYPDAEFVAPGKTLDRKKCKGL